MAIVGLSVAILALGAAGSRAPTLRSQLQLTATNATTEAKLDKKKDYSCGCVRQDVCTCGAQLDFLQCVHKACEAKKCDCPVQELQDVCTASAQSCSTDLDMACSSKREQVGCKGLFHQSADGDVGFTLDTDHIGDEAYCGPFGKCQGDLQLSAQLHRAYKGLWFQCKIKDGDDFTSCSAEVTTNDVQCKMKMVQGFKAEESLVGKCFLSEGKGGSAVTKDAWFTVTNAHGKMKAKASPEKSGAKGVSTISLGLFAAVICSAWLA